MTKPEPTKYLMLEPGSASTLSAILADLFGFAIWNFLTEMLTTVGSNLLTVADRSAPKSSASAPTGVAKATAAANTKRPNNPRNRRIFIDASRHSWRQANQ